MKYYYFLLIIVFTACTKQTPSELSRWEAHSVNTQIIRDDFGVPHIYGKTDADAVFGLLYAQCEDDFNRVEQNYMWAIGRLAEIEGEEALYSDLRAKLFMTEEEAIENYENSPDWLKKLCNAFADGVNYYLYTHPEVKPKLLTRFEPWMPMYFSEGSIGGDIEGVSTKKIQAFYENQAQNTFKTDTEDSTTSNELEPAGSNGFAISGKLTESGKAMLLINPHTSFFFRGEVHVVSEEGLNAYGAVTWGQFFVYQGFNEKTGWMHTSTYTDIKDDFVETIVKTKNGYQYKYGDELRPVKAIKQSLKYIDGGVQKEKDFTMYRTHHGPITQKNDSAWVATAIMWDPVKALTQSFTRTKLNNHTEFRNMMDIRTNSSNNTVYADADGTIAYYHGDFIPRRNTKFDYKNPVDGSNPETDWNGLHTVDEIITVVNPSNGWIQNCNSTPFTSAAENSPKPSDYPNYMSINQENFRGVHAIRLLEKAQDLTLDKLIDMAYDPYLPAFEVAIPSLIKAYDASRDKVGSLKEPIAVLRTWNFAVSKESVGMSLAHFYGQSFLSDLMIPSYLSDMEKVIYFSTKATVAQRLMAFENAITKLNEDFGSWNTPWGEINRYQRLDGNINQVFNDSLPSIPVGMTTSRWGALAAFGMRSKQTTKRIYGTRGNSFVAVVEFGNKVKAKTILAGGQSGDPASPHFSDQAQRYADVQFKDVAYYLEDVKQRAVSTYHPGEKH
ncbi:MAG: acyl-homoserine-lactone acylase [Francisellaceae bacterium]